MGQFFASSAFAAIPTNPNFLTKLKGHHAIIASSSEKGVVRRPIEADADCFHQDVRTWFQKK